MSGLFNLPPRATKTGDKKLANKAKSKTAVQGITIKKGSSLLEKIQTINAMVNKYLGKHEKEYKIVQDENELISYIDNCIEKGIIAIDTETDGLNTLTCKMAGVCLYTPESPPIYVPMHHVSYITGAEIPDQLNDIIVAKQLKRLHEAKTKSIFFNAKFDIKVLKNYLDVDIIPYWDGYVAARLLNENEPENNLKSLHNKYCLQRQGEAFSFDDLFKGIPFTHIPIKTAYLYAAGDPIKTYELYKFQEQYLTIGTEKNKSQELECVANVFHKIEMPLIPVVAKMENTGIDFDVNFSQELSKKYTKQLEEVEQKFIEQYQEYQEKIDKFRHTPSGSKLQDPINIASPQQISILLYDILNIKIVDKKTPRGTGEDILLKINHPIAKTILEHRGIAKLLSTYIDKLPNEINEKTGRIHASFNQMGTETGRFSSSEPNLQNIPSRNKEIRKMFKASNGYVLLSSDYSAQEPRITAHMSNDSKMIHAYKDDKDLYAEMASLAFGVPYEECREFRPDGTKNAKGKERRDHAKAIFLGICYGKGVKAIAEDLKISTKKAQEIYDSVLKEFTGLRQFMQDSENMAREKGYVTTLWGRKRRLLNMQLPLYEFEYANNRKTNFDPLSFETFDESQNMVDYDTIQKYTNMLNNTYNWKAKQSIIARANNEGITIKDNGGYIAEATRQCVNSRIQGSAADLTKKAMILVGNDERLKELNFRLLLTVHDELIGECPKENAEEVSKIFTELMVKAADELIVPIKCDIEITDCWYGDIIGGINKGNESNREAHVARVFDNEITRN